MDVIARHIDLKKKINHTLEKHIEYLRTYLINIDEEIAFKNKIENEKYEIIHINENKQFFTRPTNRFTINSEKPLEKNKIVEFNNDVEFENAIKGNKIKVFRTLGIFSSCYALLSLLNSEYNHAYIQQQLKNKIFFNYTAELLENDETWKHRYIGWPYDIYTTPIKLIYLFQIKNLIDIYYTNVNLNKNHHVSIDESNEKIKTGLHNIVENLRTNIAAKFDRHHEESAFLSYWAFIALTEWRNEMKATKLEDKNKIEQLDKVLFALYRWSKDQLYRQIALNSIKNSEEINLIRMIYCTLIYNKYQQFFDKKRKELEQLHCRSLHEILPKKYNNELIDTTIVNIFKTAQNNGIWKKYFPIVTINGNEGSIYPFPLTALGELMIFLYEYGFPKSLDKDLFVNVIDDSVKWVTKHEKIEYIDKDSNVEIFKYSGWRSPHLMNTHGKPECWSTALVFDSLIKIKKILTKNLTNEILKQFGFEYNDKYEPIRFIRRLDAFLIERIKEKDDEGRETAYPKKYSLKKIIYKEILYPRLIIQKEKLKVHTKDLKIKNAFLLYGPPGTGKTSLTEEVAKCLGWSFIKIDISVLIRKGMDKIVDSLSETFDLLNNLEDTVILFDEIDEYIRERQNSSNENTVILNRILTTAILTKLNEIKKNKNILYFVSTNMDLNKIDEAVQREGRFDYKLYVGYTAKEEKERYLREKLEKYLKRENTVHEDQSAIIEAIIRRLKRFLPLIKVGPTETLDKLFEMSVEFYEKKGKIVDPVIKNPRFVDVNDIYSELEKEVANFFGINLAKSNENISDDDSNVTPSVFPPYIDKHEFSYHMPEESRSIDRDYLEEIKTLITEITKLDPYKRFHYEEIKK